MTRLTSGSQATAGWWRQAFTPRLVEAQRPRIQQVANAVPTGEEIAARLALGTLFDAFTAEAATAAFEDSPGVVRELRRLLTGRLLPTGRTSEDHEHTVGRIGGVSCGNVVRACWGRVTTADRWVEGLSGCRAG